MTDPAPDSTAVRTALWRALHVELDTPPHLIADVIGLELADPEQGWRDRPDMHPIGTRPFRVGIAARTRFVEDLLVSEGFAQYVLLGAGLDTFAQRRPVGSERVVVFEVDQPGPQAWKRARLESLGYGVPDSLRLVPVNFEADANWWQAVVDHGFDPQAKTLVSSSGVSMYITKAATAETLRLLTSLPSGSTVVMTFMLPIETLDDADRPGIEGAARGAKASGTPWISFYSQEEMEALARSAGFAEVRTATTVEIAQPYLADRTDGLAAANGEALLIART